MSSPTKCVAAGAVALAIAGCGAGGGAGHSSATGGTTAALTPTAHRTPAAPHVAAAHSTACQDRVTRTLAKIAARIYAQAAAGGNVTSAVRRLARSPALGAAVAAGDGARVRAVLAPLLKAQIVRIRVMKGSHLLADVGHAEALAPVRGVIRSGGRPVGTYTMSVGDTRAIVGIMHGLTGAQVLLRRGHHQVEGTLSPGPATLPTQGTVDAHGTAYRVASFATHTFPGGPARLYLLVPPTAAQTCGATAAETAAQTIGAVGQRLFAAESSGPAVHAALRTAARDRPFVDAVRTRNAAALRVAIVHLFQIHRLHIVRVRATAPDGSLIGDVGGPFVLAPSSADLHDAAGRTIGRVTLAVQDDTGYIKLMNRFTGADVVLRTPAGEVPGSSLTPGPANVPAHGAVDYGGVRYEAFSFTGEMFPSGPLTIDLLLPPSVA